MATQSATSDTGVRAAVELANVPTLVAMLADVTGDERWTDDTYRSLRVPGMDDNDTGGLTPAAQQEVRDAAADLITVGRAEPARRDPATLVRVLSAAMGENVPAEYGPMIRADLAAITGCPDREAQSLPGKTAVIIGAGVSGLAAAVVLERAGIDCQILERRDELGGTWFENRYPGAGVDTPSHLYQYSFLPHDWAEYFSAQRDVHAYLNRVAEHFDLRRRIRFGAEVGRARFDETTDSWRVELAGGEVLVADVVISAVGAFNQPRVPRIDGVAGFRGPAFHTARWPSVDLRDKRVAVVGNGASAMQVVPAIAPTVRSLTVFQRSPHWIAPFPKFHAEVPAPLRGLLRDVPLYHGWYRQRLAWTWNDRLHPTLQRDPQWPHPERSVNADNDRHRAYFTAYIERELADRPNLVRAVVPTYPPYGKRILLDNGWYRALRRPNVDLVTSPVTRLERGSVRVEAGTEHPADAVVFATGFNVVSFLSTIEVVGRGGRSLHDVWDGDDARAFLGLAVPGFPNFFILYGPNTQPGHGGSLISAVEAQLHYIVAALASSAGPVEVRREVFDEYNAKVDRAHERMVWTHPGMATYYRNTRGRVVVNTPFRIVDFWTMSRRDPTPDLVGAA